MQRVYDVEIAGTPLKLRTTNDEDTVQELVKLVDDKVQKVLEATKNGSFQNAVLITALNMAEEICLLKKTANKEIGRLDRKAQELLSTLESAPLPQVEIDQ